MFIGRENELRLMHALIVENRPTIGVIYGRRRIGKSELIKKAFEKKRVLTFEGLENRPKKEQIDNFLFQLFYQTRKKFFKGKVKTWREAFLHLHEELQRESAHVVFDEFQWMANYRNEIVSELKMAWDLYLSKNDGITLILCGSIASFMIDKVVKSNSLYGRTDLVIHLKGFLLPDTGKMLEGKGLHEIMEAWMLLGGVPKYLELIRDKPSVRVGMESLAFSETGYLTDESLLLFGRISQSGAFSSWMGRAFEYLCMAHAGKISEILGFPGIEFSHGPYFNAPGRGKPGVQIDLLFDRKDNVITLCEMKYSMRPVGVSVIEELERKIEVLRSLSKNKTIQKVLISRAGASTDLASTGYFYRIIKPEELCRPPGG